MRSLLLFVCLHLLAAPPIGDAAKVKMDAAQLARISPRMKAFVEEGTIAGAVGLVARNGEIVYHEAVGVADIEAKRPMRIDSIFQIMSMTKPVVAVGIMMLVEEGKIALSDPVERHLPEFRGQWMLDGDSDGKTRQLRRPSRPITIRDLMTHTSGMQEPDESANGLYQKMHLSLSDAVLLFARQPLLFEPGSRWRYSSPGIAVLGRIIEVRSGMAFEKFMEQRIFQPLGMKDSFFFPPPDRIDRIAMVYRIADGRLQRSGPDILGGDPALYRKGARFPAPEWGLYSTAADLFSLYQCMLDGGTYQGKRILLPASVKLMTKLHTGDIEPAGHWPGRGYALAWTVIKDEIGTLHMQSKGTFGHGGAFGTEGWVDPVKHIVGVFMIQRSGGGQPYEARTFMSMAGAAAID
jgi:CubicO group peptidase (beta-lactamase class C family)